MVATKLLATLNQTPTPGKRTGRSASFDHTALSPTPSARTPSFDHTVPAAKQATSGDQTTTGGGTGPSSKGTEPPGAAAAGAGDTSSAHNVDAQQNPTLHDAASYWDAAKSSAKSYAGQAYGKYAPYSSAPASANADTHPPALTSVSEEDGGGGGYIDYIGKIQQSVTNQLSSIYINSYTNLNDLVSGHPGAATGAEDGRGGELIMAGPAPSPVSNGYAGGVRRGPPIELGWLMRNPYTVVSGRHNVARSRAPSSVNAVRSLLTLVPVQPEYVDELDTGSDSPTASNRRVRFRRPHSPGVDIQQPKLDTRTESAESDDADQEEKEKDPHALPLSESMTSTRSVDPVRLGGGSSQVSDAETASRLAEGTIRALRDLALEEAVELHEALRFWTERYDRPLLSWLEAGPTVWLSQDGYNHRVVGRKVSQIQAVLARRCTSVGELQEHLLRAGWQRGVEKWGVLGQGGEWAAVAGGDGGMEESTRSLHEPAGVPLSRENSTGESQGSGRSMRDYYSFNSTVDNEKSMRILGPQTRRRSTYYGQAEVMVKHTRGGRIERDDPALAAWTVDALRVVRDHLYKAGNTSLRLPCYENWRDEVHHFSSSSNLRGDLGNGATTPVRFQSTESLPLWATEDASTSDYHSPDRRDDRQTKFRATGIKEHGTSELPPTIDDDDGNVQNDGMDEEVDSFIQSQDTRQTTITGDVMISDLTLFAQEISTLLDSMEVLMQNQRRRRLMKLKPPPRMKRQWYVASVLAPAGGYIALKIFKDGYIKEALQWAAEQLGNFYNEHLSMPIKSIYGELVKGKPDVTDKKARLEAITTLKNMIGSWLDETFPAMNESDKIHIADAMDISLVEKAKEESIKRSVFEINNIVRLSMIEMQFIKKELMSALVAMDELMSSNEINAKIAAMTPALILLYGTRSIFRFCYYALLKFGKSREETFQSFRHTILDIERLLTMRDNPPDAPPPLSGSLPSVTPRLRRSVNRHPVTAESRGGNVLDSNDLGMLMLHIHECRKLLWEDRRRFSSTELRNVTEDLAELAGERGPVSVQQQLAIIARMCRTYSFLKVISTGHSFDFAFRSSL